jgi:hypothetical protein
MTSVSKIWLVILLLVCSLQLCCAQTSSSKIQYLGTWVVQDVLCSNCKRVPVEKGTVIELGANQILNPLSENCVHEPGYGLLREMAAEELLAHSGRDWPGSVKQAIRGQRRVLYGFVTCEGINLMQLLFLSDQRAFYFFEGGLMFDLRRRG